MFHRRAFMTSVLALTTAGALPAWAQHADLDADTSSDDTPMRRRYMMEDVHGNIVKDEDLQGRFVLIYFGYTSCPDVCPTTLSVISDVMEDLGELNDGLSVLFVTVDPDRDTPQVLAEYTAFFDPRIIALRGPKPYTDHMVKAFNARYEFHYPDPENKDEYSVDHTASVAFVGPDGNLIRRFPYGMAAEDIAADIRATMQAAMGQ